MIQKKLSKRKVQKMYEQIIMIAQQSGQEQWVQDIEYKKEDGSQGHIFINISLHDKNPEETHETKPESV